MALSNYLENKLIDFLFRGVAFTPPQKLYIALCTTTPTAADTGSTIIEVNDDDYTRKTVNNGTSKWYTTQGDLTAISTGDTGSTSNVSPITWTAISWSATVTAVAVCDQAIIYFILLP